MNRLLKIGLSTAVIGALTWIVALEAILRTMGDDRGANIGAGLLLLVGRGMFAAGVVFSALAAAIAISERNSPRS